MFQFITSPGTKLVATAIAMFRVGLPAMPVTLGLLLGMVTSAGAQVAPVEPIPEPPPQMCGDGTPLEVELPGGSLGLSHTIYKFSASGTTTAPADKVTLPGGCSIYLFIVSDYAQNSAFDQIPFYKVAEYVAQHNGYVHVSWWNNLNKEYMAGPLHPTTTTINSPLNSAEVVSTNPGGYDGVNQVPAVGFASNFLNKPKAIPVEDHRFVADAARVIEAIKQLKDPVPIVVVLGHGMGATSAARLASVNVITGDTRPTRIDLLGLIDPMGSRDAPMDLVAEFLGKNRIGSTSLADLVGLPSQHTTFNYGRWRGVYQFLGFKAWDCDRGGLFGACQMSSYKGRPIFPCGPAKEAFQAKVPLLTTYSVFCPFPFPWVDRGTQLKFGSNVANLYHRWQTEYLPHVAGSSEWKYSHPVALSNTIHGRNYQHPVSGTCKSGTDDENDNAACSAFDGHFELIGARGGNSFGAGRAYPGLQMQAWPTDADGRREKLIELATADAGWLHRPQKPDLCLVCDDIIAIIDRIRPADLPPTTTFDTTAPGTTAAATPEPNAGGWNAEDVVVDLVAVDELEGSGVKEIEHSLGGAQTAPPTVTAGAGAQVTVSAEGTTTLTFFARDLADNQHPTEELTIKIDKTGPGIAADPDVPPNAAGWNSTDVTVTFTAEDELSGPAWTDAPVTVTTEGALEVRGSATDNAGNISTASLALNIDKTPPTITLADRTPAANAAGWNNIGVAVTWNCEDAVSGAVAPSVWQSANDEGAAQSVTGECADIAGHTAVDTEAGINIDMTPPSITLASRTAANAAGWSQTDVTVVWNCVDLLSGPGSPTLTQMLAGEGAAQSVTETCQDLADNSASDTQNDINIDKTPPTIALADRMPAANAAGWNNTGVAVTWNCADAVSGEVAPSVSQSANGEGAAQRVTGECADNAGHTAGDTEAGINIDMTPPSITLASLTAANAGGWNRTDVTAVWNCVDPLSGPGSPNVTQMLANEGAAQSLTGTCLDLADNSASDTRGGINIDKTAPTVNIGSPANGAVFLLNAQVNAAYSCDDSLSGPHSCNGPVAAGATVHTASVGGQQFTVNASDVAGNTASATHDYVVQYAFSGFGNPIGRLPTANVAKAGRTVPVKYFLQDANGALIADVATFASLTSAPAACDATTPGVMADETTAAGSTTVRWDAAANQFIYNWATDAAWAGTCRMLQLLLNDGTQHLALFRFN